MRTNISHLSFLTLIPFMLVIFFAQTLQAAWGSNGLPIAPYPQPQPDKIQMVADGTGGMIVTWQDQRNGMWDIYAQRKDAEGNSLWTQGGAICTASGSQSNPQIIADGQGGAIIVWDDNRNGSLEIYAQRVDASGDAQWITDGVSVCTDAAVTFTFPITPDGAGGVIITWRDFRNFNHEIYAQRINASGVSLWVPEGIPVCQESGQKNNLQTTVDGTGGAIMAWEDSRNGIPNLYGQRIDALGNLQWTPPGVLIYQATMGVRNPRIATDENGGAIIAWEEFRNPMWGIFAQRVNALGLIQWTEDGIPLCDVSAIQLNLQIISDGDGGMIGAWEDVRNGFNEVFVQRINGSGVVSWTNGGEQICQASHLQYSPQLISDGLSGAIVTWDDTRNSSYGVFAQRISQSGGLQWLTDGIPMATSSAEQSTPQMASYGIGGAYITWLDQRSGTTEIYGQHLDSSGDTQWNTAESSILAAPGTQENNQAVSDGTGGSIVIWLDERNGNMGVFAQRVDASGVILWPYEGVHLGLATENQYVPQIITDTVGGAIITWREFRDGSYRIYAQRIDEFGTVRWADGGVTIGDRAHSQATPHIIPDGVSGAIITWSDVRNGSADVYAQKINDLGRNLWAANGVRLCMAAGYQHIPQITSDGMGGAIVVWDDDRYYGNGVYAQRIDEAGELLWGSNGVGLCTAAGYQYNPQIASDGAGGAIVIWDDNRNFSFDIYAQRIDASGTLQWAIDGVAICLLLERFGYYQILSNGSGGVIISWQDKRTEIQYDIYTQAINALGVVQWETNGVPLCTQSGDQQYPRMSTDGAGGAIVTWQDYRGVDYDIFAQRITASGAPMWALDGLSVCLATGHQEAPQIAFDETGGAVISWEDGRSGLNQIHAQRISGHGAGPICDLDPEVIEIPGIIEIGAFFDTTMTVSNFGSEELTGFIDEACNNFAIISGGGSFTLGSGQSHLVAIRFEPIEEGTHQCSIETGIDLCQSVVVIGTAPGGTSAVPLGLPTRFALHSCAPNPFNPHTTIRYDLPEAMRVNLHIYDIAGRLVRTLVAGELVGPGRQEMAWRGCDDTGRQVAAGVYFYRLVAGRFEETKRMALIK